MGRKCCIIEQRCAVFCFSFAFCSSIFPVRSISWMGKSGDGEPHEEKGGGTKAPRGNLQRWGTAEGSLFLLN